MGTSFAIGESLATGSPQAHVAATTASEIRQTWNVIAETRGSKRNVVMAGAHLDSVQDGHGINDNGSGSAVLLEVAEQLAHHEKPNNRVRLAWWGAEELGLLGSEHYVEKLSTNRENAFRKIALYLNFDMVGSPNYALMVYDGDNSTYGTDDGAAVGPAGSGSIERMFHRFFDKLGTGSDETPFSGRSDYGPFIALNVPAGGLFTGAEGVKTPEQAVQFGGEAGAAYDACYHQSCDNLANLDTRALSQQCCDRPRDREVLPQHPLGQRRLDRPRAAPGCSAPGPHAPPPRGRPGRSLTDARPLLQRGFTVAEQAPKDTLSDMDTALQRRRRPCARAAGVR